jgi:hypothetical protein
MNKRRILGVFLISLSLIIFVSNFRITGAVIGTLLTNFFSIIAIASLLVGLFLIIQSRELELIAEEGIALPKDAVFRLNSIYPNENKTLVLDTSYIRAYTAMGIKELINSLRNYDQILVPEKVLGELRHQEKNDSSLSPLRMYVENLPRPQEGFEVYRKASRSYLEKGRKNVFYETIIPILLGDKEPPKTRREVAPLMAESKKLLGFLKKDGLLLTKDNLKKVVDSHYRVSAADVDVLAASIAEIRYTGRPVVIAEKDVDFEDAVRQIHNKPSRRINWKLIEYETPYSGTR